MASKSGKKSVNVMAVMIHPDGSKEEFIFNRNAMSISRFNPVKIINQEDTPFTKGDGKVS